MEIDLSWLQNYFGLLSFWQAAAGVAFALTPPIIFLVTLRRSAVVSFQTTLILYSVILVLGLGGLWLLGIVLQSAAPETFDLWREAANSGVGGNPVSFIIDVLGVLPLMILVSSIAYALIDRKKWLATAIIGVVCAVVAYGAMFAGIILVACWAWASCI